MMWKEDFGYSSYEVYHYRKRDVFLYRLKERPVETQSWEINGRDESEIDQVPLGPSKEPPFEYAEAMIALLMGGS